MEKGRIPFPWRGKTRAGFSMAWKRIFHAVENQEQEPTHDDLI